METPMGSQDPEWWGMSSRWGPPGNGAPGASAPGAGRPPTGAVGDGRSNNMEGPGAGNPPGSPGGMDGGIGNGGQWDNAAPVPAHFSAAQVMAVAAAAVEVPNSPQKNADSEMLSKVRDAQKAASRRRSGGSSSFSPGSPGSIGSPGSPAGGVKPDAHTAALTDIMGAQRQAARRRPGGAEEINNMIWNAQLKNIPAAQADAMAAPKWSSSSTAGQDYYNGGYSQGWAENGQLTPEALLGHWVDMQGNLVRVYSIDAWELRLMASMARPNKPDLQFALRPSLEGGWTCGNNTMDTSMSSLEQLHWITPSGDNVVWFRGRE